MVFSETYLLLIVNSDFGVESALLGGDVLRDELEHGRASISVAEDLPVLSSPLEQLSEIWMCFKVLINKSNSIFVSWEISVELEGKDVAVAHLGATLFLVNYLLLNVSFEEIE